MPDQYQYKAVTASGVHEKGEITALGINQVKEYLNERDLIPVKIKKVAQKSSLTFFGFQNRTNYEQLILFTNSLSTLYKAGIPLLKALSIISVGKKTDPINIAIQQIKLQIQSGRLLSQAMAEYPNIFSAVYRSSIIAGEESGTLDSTLDELAIMLENEQELQRQVKSALRYPMMVIGILIAAFVVIMTFVVPRFVDFYDTFNAELPMFTKLIISISNFISVYWMLILLGSIISGYIMFRLFTTENGRKWFDQTILKIPVMGGLVIKSNVSRFCFMLRILFQAGLPLVKSLSILTDVIKNKSISSEIELLENSIRHGESLTDNADKFEFFPDQALHVIAIGVESGNLDKMLQEIGNHYSKEVMYTSRQLTSIIEPILTLILGLFVLILALAIFLPMWNIVKIFNG